MFEEVGSVNVGMPVHQSMCAHVHPYPSGVELGIPHDMVPGLL